MKSLFRTAFAAIALFACAALSMPSPSLATTTEPGFMDVVHTIKAVPVAHVIASTASHDLAAPMSAGSRQTRETAVETASLPSTQMKPGRLARIDPIPWRI